MCRYCNLYMATGCTAISFGTRNRDNARGPFYEMVLRNWRLVGAEIHPIAGVAETERKRVGNGGGNHGPGNHD